MRACPYSGANGGTGIGEFPVATPIVTGGPVSTSRAVSSWYFGDGAALLNAVNAGFGVTARLTPLDGAPRTAVFDRNQSVAFGFRVGRTLTRRIDAEFSFDYVPGSLKFTGDALEAIEDARSSFIPAWNGLLGTGFTFNRQVSSVAELEEGDGHQMSAMGAMRIYFNDSGRFRPFATAGGGVVFERGTLPSGTLTGSYSFLFGSMPQRLPMNERDVVTTASDGRQLIRRNVWGGFDP